MRTDTRLRTLEKAIRPEEPDYTILQLRSAELQLQRGRAHGVTLTPPGDGRKPGMIFVTFPDEATDEDGGLAPGWTVERLVAHWIPEGPERDRLTKIAKGTTQTIILCYTKRWRPADAIAS